MIFFPPFLGGVLLQPGLAVRGVLPFFSFCLASSAGYILNDIRDCENDRQHPEKKGRAIAAGRISVVAASLLAILLVFGAGFVGWQVSLEFFSCLTAYILLTIAYSLFLKQYALIDIFCISAGFLLRLEAGGLAFDIRLSEWLFLSVFLLSIFLGTGKRFSEKKRLGLAAANHRKALQDYPEGFLQGVMYMTGGAVLVTYTMYAISRHSTLLIYTVPLCCFGLLRYILRIQSGRGGDPTESLLNDFSLFVVGVLWSLMVGWGIYAK
jgi:4-hydroxybenzoate polyprenyltransferase